MATVFVIPMPTPRSPNAPFFKGERVTDFLDCLEAHATAANVQFNDLPAYVLRYCHRHVRNIIDSSNHWTQHDWATTRSYLVDLYGSNDRKPKNSPERLRKWVKFHADTYVFSRLQDVDRYYREFTAQSTPLISASCLTTNEANFLFYKGIPRSMRKKIKRKIPDAHQTASSAPSIASVLGYLRDEFHEDDIDSFDLDNDLDLFSDSDSDFGLLDIDDLESRFKRPQTVKKKVKSTADTTRVPTGTTVKSQISKPLEALKRQLEAELQAVKNEHDAMLQEFRAMKPTNASNDRLSPTSQYASFLYNDSDDFDSMYMASSYPARSYPPPVSRRTQRTPSPPASPHQVLPKPSTSAAPPMQRRPVATDSKTGRIRQTRDLQDLSMDERRNYVQGKRAKVEFSAASPLAIPHVLPSPSRYAVSILSPQPTPTEPRTNRAHQIADLQEFSINFSRRFPEPSQTRLVSTCNENIAPSFATEYGKIPEGSLSGDDDGTTSDDSLYDSEVPSVASQEYGNEENLTYGSDFDDDISEEQALDDTDIMPQDYEHEEPNDHGDVVTNNSRESLTTSCELDPDRNLNQDCYSCSASTTTSNASTPINDTPQDSGYDEAVEHQRLILAMPDSAKLKTTPLDYGYENARTHGNVPSIELFNHLFVSWDSACPPTDFRELDASTFDANFCSAALLPDNSTLMALRSEDSFHSPSVVSTLLVCPSLPPLLPQEDPQDLINTELRYPPACTKVIDNSASVFKVSTNGTGRQELTENESTIRETNRTDDVTWQFGPLTTVHADSLSIRRSFIPAAKLRRDHLIFSSPDLVLTD